MSVYQFSNFGQTTLANGLTASSTLGTLALGTGGLMPSLSSGQIFAAILTDAATKTINEVVYVTNISGDLVTMERGQEGTSATTWASGDYFAMKITAGTMASVRQSGQSVPRVLQSSSGSISAGTTLTLVASLTAPVNGQIWAQGYQNLNDVLSISGSMGFVGKLFNSVTSDYSQSTTKLSQSHAIVFSVPNGTTAYVAMTAVGPSDLIWTYYIDSGIVLDFQAS